MDPLSATPQSPAPQKSKTPLILSIIGGLAVIGVAIGLINKQEEKKESVTQNASADQDQQSAVASEESIEQPQVNDISPVVPAATSSSPVDQTAPPAAAGKVSAATYKDGTYSADATYQSPAGQEDVHVTVTLKNNIVTDSSFSGTPRSPRSQMMMDAFGQHYQSLVIGKKIDEIHLTQVSGSSLTPIGFNNALTKIEAEAKM
jgi:type II secretory pathway pseudopilin PulG